MSGIPAMLKWVGRRTVPSRLWQAARAVRSSLARRRAERHLERCRRKVWGLRQGERAECLGYTVRVTDGPNFYMQYKDEFINKIYDFASRRPDPFIIDGGSNIGMSVLYFKRAYPRARVIGFEPDPDIFRLLTDNVASNGLTDVRLVNAGLGAGPGTAAFVPDRSAGGRVCEPPNGSALTVTVHRLSDYLTEPADFVKLNIEGMELAVLREVEASGRLPNVREMVVEYHGWPDGRQGLGEILNLLDRNGFRYLIHDFDAETCAATKPPFRLTPETTWFCLVYAKQL
jgi:FkbM family methyltransferase